MPTDDRYENPRGSRRGCDGLPRVSVVLPLYNEAAVLERLVTAVTDALTSAGVDYEIIFVNDGSCDGSTVILDRMADTDSRLRVVHFSRNFGHQAAVQAGIAHATGDAVIIMDSDMQDDPRCLAEFVRNWQAGYDVVYAVRRKRKEGLLKRTLFYSFYRLLNAVSDSPLPNDAGNFGLLDRRVAEAVSALPESDRYFPGLRHWVGFRQLGIPVERGARHDDQPRVTLLGLVRLAKAAVFSFSSAPLSMFYCTSAVSLLVCGLFSCFTLFHKFQGTATPGWTSTIIIASFFGALNAFGISILGEYVVRIYAQVRGRPPFLVARTRNFDSPTRSATEAPPAPLVAGPDVPEFVFPFVGTYGENTPQPVDSLDAPKQPATPRNSANSKPRPAPASPMTFEFLVASSDSSVAGRL